ncbi:baseplate assembly protein [Burkholderia metallica]|uniref:phage GP46 family protein n=1 Tax=Burkholderia metallica TaxID=488729 RepID=UPI00157B3A94|nr:phage GP46 family protein [Burkholderia metallica]NTZ82401.1 baseplate assembly protein [Burkholderia metallica]
MLKLIQTDWGKFDVALDDPALADADAAAATLVYAVLFTDVKAPDGKVEDTFDRRGWWEDSTAGTGLWYVRRQPLNSPARREAINMVRTALMAQKPALTDIDVQEAVTETAGNVSSVVLEVRGFHNGRKFIVRAPL